MTLDKADQNRDLTELPNGKLVSDVLTVLDPSHLTVESADIVELVLPHALAGLVRTRRHVLEHVLERLETRTTPASHRRSLHTLLVEAAGNRQGLPLERAYAVVGLLAHRVGDGTSTTRQPMPDGLDFLKDEFPGFGEGLHALTLQAMLPLTERQIEDVLVALADLVEQLDLARREHVRRAANARRIWRERIARLKARSDAAEAPPSSASASPAPAVERAVDAPDADTRPSDTPPTAPTLAASNSETITAAPGSVVADPPPHGESSPATRVLGTLTSDDLGQLFATARRSDHLLTSRQLATLMGWVTKTTFNRNKKRMRGAVRPIPGPRKSLLWPLVGVLEWAKTRGLHLDPANLPEELQEHLAVVESRREVARVPIDLAHAHGLTATG